MVQANVEYKEEQCICKTSSRLIEYKTSGRDNYTRFATGILLISKVHFGGNAISNVISGKLVEFSPEIAQSTRNWMKYDKFKPTTNRTVENW